MDVIRTKAWKAATAAEYAEGEHSHFGEFMRIYQFGNAGSGLLLDNQDWERALMFR